jgi:hypothetical protein
MNSRTVARVGLVILGVQGLISGVWAQATPRGFYDDFPGFGRHWVSADGPYNEHLVRDYGALNLALAVLAFAAAIWCTRALVITAAAAWLVYSVPHLLYHALNLGGHHYETGDKVGIIGGLVLVPVIAAVVLFCAPEEPAST